MPAMGAKTVKHRRGYRLRCSLERFGRTKTAIPAQREIATTLGVMSGQTTQFAPNEATGGRGGLAGKTYWCQV